MFKMSASYSGQVIYNKDTYNYFNTHIIFIFVNHCNILVSSAEVSVQFATFLNNKACNVSTFPLATNICSNSFNRGAKVVTGAMVCQEREAFSEAAIKFIYLMAFWPKFTSNILCFYTILVLI